VHNFGRTSIQGLRLTFSLAAPDSSPRRFTVHLPNGSTQVVDVDRGRTQEVQVVVNAAPGHNAVTITTDGAGESIDRSLSATNTDHRIVYGKLLDLRAQVAEPKVHIAVVQQRGN